jgi:hypothetical protein
MVTSTIIKPLGNILADTKRLMDMVAEIKQQLARGTLVEPEAPSAMIWRPSILDVFGANVAAARDSSEAAAADSRFAEIFLASDLPDQDPDAFPSCTVVIEQFDRLERHHEQVGRNRGTRAASSGF